HHQGKEERAEEVERRNGEENQDEDQAEVRTARHRGVIRASGRVPTHDKRGERSTTRIGAPARTSPRRFAARAENTLRVRARRWRKRSEGERPWIKSVSRCL